MVDDKNVLVKEFKKYLDLNYSNEKTRELYLKEAKRFLNKIAIRDGKEPTKVNQNMIDTYVIFINSKRNINPFYKGYVRAWVECFDPEGEDLKLKLKKNRSREAKDLDEYDWLEKEAVDEIIAKTPPYISITVQIMFWTGLRKMEVLNADLSKKQNNEIGIKVIDFEKRRFIGLGKGNKEFSVHFPENLSERLQVWLTECQDPLRPFTMYKRNGDEFKNVDKQYWYMLKKEVNKLNIKLANGNNIHPHCIQKKAKILTLDGWKSYKDIKPKDKILSYNMYKKTIEEDIVKKINIFKFDDILLNIKKNKDINTLITPTHKNIIKLCKNIGSKNKTRGKDIWDKNYKLCSFDEILKTDYKIPFKNYKKSGYIRNIKLLLTGKKSQTKQTLGVYKAGILGWILTDGCINWKGNSANITISQSWLSNRKKCYLIENLLKKAKLQYTKNIGKKIYKKEAFNGKYSYWQQPCVFRICNSNVKWIFDYLTDKKRLIYNSFLKLNYNELKSLYNTMMLGDGSRNREFTTQNKQIIDFFRTIVSLIGYQSTLGYGKLTYKKGKKYRVYIKNTNRKDGSTPDSVQILPKKHIFYKHFKGVVWCPETKNHTWIAKDNETIFITGNSLRHSICRWLRRKKGFDIETLAKFARHDDPKTTMRYSGATQEEVEKKLDEEVFNNEKN